jgi:hypothetical protein
MTQDTKIPDNHVLAVIHGDSAADALERELRRKGFEETMILGGAAAQEKIDVAGEESNPIAGAMKALAGHLSDQVAYLEQYEEQARQGNKIVAVKVEDRDQAQDVKDVLEQYGAFNVRFFGKLAVTDMTAATNPSTQADERK